MEVSNVIWMDGQPTNFVAVGGREPDGLVEQTVAHTSPVTSALKREAMKIFVKAETLLMTRSNPNFPERNTRIALHGPHTGHHKLDYTIHLIYTGKDAKHASIAAKSVEYGHMGSGKGGPFQQRRRYPGLWVIHDAAGLRRKEKGITG